MYLKRVELISKNRQKQTKKIAVYNIENSSDFPSPKWNNNTQQNSNQNSNLKWKDNVKNNNNTFKNDLKELQELSQEINKIKEICNISEILQNLRNLRKELSTCTSVSKQTQLSILDTS